MSFWKSIVKQQMNIITKSRLREICDNIFICFLGNKQSIQWILNDKIKLICHSTNLLHFERLCLQTLKEQCKNYDDRTKILYIHSKGVSKISAFRHNIMLWRQYMEYFLIERYKECLQYLDEGYDTVGLNLLNGGNDYKIDKENHKWHYSGNFWWSVASHLRRIPDIPDIPMNKNNAYWLCERWILQPLPDMKVLELYHTPTPHLYQVKCDRNSYVGKLNLRTIKNGKIEKIEN